MTPATNVTLYKSKLDISNRFVMYVTDANDARTQVTNLSTKFLYLNNCFWQRDNISIRAPYNIEQLREYNYCSYINGPSGNYIFAFITSLTYVNDDLTYINIKTDSWMTYSHRCNFLPSLMNRCHPEPDEESNNFNYFSETISPLLVPDKKTVTIGGDKSVSLIYITSQVDLDTLELNKYPDAYTQWIKYCNTPTEGDADPYYTWWNAKTAKGITIGGIPQRPTAGLSNNAASLETFTMFLTWLNECNLSDLIVSTYVVPAGFCPETSGQLTGDLEFVEQDLESSISWKDTANWKKIYYSPQFNKLSYRFCGRSVEIPFERLDGDELKTGTADLNFKFVSNWSEDGCAFIKPIINGGDEFVIASQGWDKFSFSVFSGSTLQSLTDQYNQNLKRVQRIAGLVSAGVGLGLGMNTLSAGIGGALGEQAANYFNENNFLPTEAGPYGSRAVNRTARSLSSMVGAAGAGVMAFKQLNPLSAAEIPSSANVISTTSGSLMTLLKTQDPLTINHEYPVGDSMTNLNNYFGMWGYDQGGLIHSINTDPGSLKFKYYRTEDCVLTGDCPQENIEEIKGLFDSGIFIFRDSGDYKNLDVANNHY